MLCCAENVCVCLIVCVWYREVRLFEEDLFDRFCAFCFPNRATVVYILWMRNLHEVEFVSLSVLVACTFVFVFVFVFVFFIFDFTFVRILFSVFNSVYSANFNAIYLIICCCILYIYFFYFFFFNIYICICCCCCCCYCNFFVFILSALFLFLFSSIYYFSTSSHTSLTCHDRY